MIISRQHGIFSAFIKTNTVDGRQFKGNIWGYKNR
jgi:hypothetical protein